MTFNIHIWLCDHGFGFIAKDLTDDFDTLQEIVSGLTLKKIIRLGGTEEDYSRLLLEANRSIAIQKSSEKSSHDQLIQRLPVFISQPYEELLIENHARVKLHRLFDVAELVVRWSCSVLLSGVRKINDNKLPIDLAVKLKGQIEKPSFGKWVSILRDTSQFLGKTPNLPEGLTGWLRWINDVDGKRTKLVTMVGEEFSRDRNILAHSGGGSMRFCQTMFETHWPKLQQIVEGLASKLDGAELVGIRNGEIQNLKGSNPYEMAIAPYGIENGNNGVWLLDNHKWSLELWPLMRDDLLRTVHSNESNSNIPKTALPQCYVSTKKGKTLVFVPFGSDEPCSYIEDEHFREFFLLDERTRNIPQWRKFVEQAKTEADQLIGRENESGQIHSWLDICLTSPGNSPRLGVIFGGPGMGKSILISKIVADLESQWGHASKGIPSYYFHRFRRGTEDCTPDTFFEYLGDALDAWFPLNGIKHDSAKQEDNQQEQATLLQIVARKLRQMDELAPSKRFLVLIDGLDEVSFGFPEFPEVIENLMVPGTIWLISSRQEGKIPIQLNKFEKILGGQSVLQPLSSTDIRAMLERIQPAVRYALIKRDSDEHGDLILPENPFVNAVIRKAEGNPLYVYFLIQDLEDKRFEVTNERQLPSGLFKYYEMFIAGLGISDTNRVRPFMVALLACSEEPLSRESLRWLTNNMLEAKVIDDAILSVGTMLRYSPTPEEDDGIMLYHTHFREYLITPGNPLRGTLFEARQKLIDIGSTCIPLENAGPLKGYMARNGIYHLLNADRVAEAINLLDHLKSRNDRMSLVLPRGMFSAVTKQIMIKLRNWFDQGEMHNLSQSDLLLRNERARSINPKTLADILDGIYESGIYRDAIRVLLEFHEDVWWNNAFNIKDRFLSSFDIVARHTVGEALSDQYLNADQQARDALISKINKMAFSVNINEREAAGYALQEIYVELPELIDDKVITRWAESDTNTERMILGELLVNLAQSGCLDIGKRIRGERFWKPVWEYHEIDLLNYCVITKCKGLPSGVTFDEKKLEQAESEYQKISAVIDRLIKEPFVCEANSVGWPLFDLLNNFANLNTSQPALHKAIQSSLEEALDGSQDEMNIGKDIIRVLSSHSLWTVSETCSSILANMISSDDRRIELVKELLGDRDFSWRLTYSMVDTAFNVREIDDYDLFRKAFKENFNHPVSRVRGICFDDFFAWIRLSNPLHREELIHEFESEIRESLMTATDCWEIEYLYLLFKLLDQDGFDVHAWILDNKILASYFGDVAVKPFYRLDRQEFLLQIDRIRSEEV